jgi:hypothetical protein
MLRRAPKLYRFSNIPTVKNKKMKIIVSRRGRRERRDGREKAALNNPLNRFFSFSALSAASAKRAREKPCLCKSQQDKRSIKTTFSRGYKERLL